MMTGMVLQHSEPTDEAAAIGQPALLPDTPLTVTAPVPYAATGGLRNPFPRSPTTASCPTARTPA